MNYGEQVYQKKTGEAIHFPAWSPEQNVPEKLFEHAQFSAVLATRTNSEIHAALEGQLPYSLTGIFDQRDFSKFSSQVEMINGWAHVRVGGKFALVQTSIEDPVFWVLSAWIDDVWHKWEVQNGVDISNYPESFLNRRLEPFNVCLLYTSPSPRDQRGSRMPSSA